MKKRLFVFGLLTIFICACTAAELNTFSGILDSVSGRESEGYSGGSSSGYSGRRVQPKGACVYGPPGYKVCINGTYQDECINNFKGKWYMNSKCR